MKELKVKRFFVSSLILAWLGIFLFLFCGRVFAAIPASERAALIALYNSANGDDWYLKNTWKQPPLAADGFALPGTEKDWHGITCNMTNTAVQKISLRYSGPQGTLPPELGTLTRLRELILSGHIGGSIPPELGSLKNLRDLQFSRCYSLTGNIPPELGNLTQLRRFSFGQARISGSIPPELGNLTNLQHLHIYDCYDLTGNIPPELGSLTNLQRLSFSWCGISGSIPPELGSLLNLQYLLITRCRGLTGNIPPELGSLKNLESFYLSENKFSSSIPPELGNMTKLRVFHLKEPNISGSIPPQLGNLTNLELLQISCGDSLTGNIPPELGNLTKLRKLILSGNISGGLPPELGSLSNLEYFRITGCDGLTGSIPPEFGSLTNLGTLWLQQNNLSGSIPPELGNLTRLYHLLLDHNKFTGSIPDTLGNLTNLHYLFLNCNCLSGEIPAALGDLTWLKELDLSSNRLSGAIPASLQNLVYLGNPYGSFRGISLCWNALYTRNAALRDFIDSHDGSYNNWQTQTVAPEKASASTASPYSVDLQWEPIIYKTDPGCYRVFFSTSTRGPFKYFGKTEDKYASSMTVTGLKPGTTYYFKIQTRTRPHANNQNTVDSEFSRVVSATTGTAFFTISGTVTTNGSGLGGVALALSNSSESVKDSRAAGSFPALSNTGSGETVFTDARGNYRTVVDYGWSGKITPAKGYYRFTPSIRTYTSVSSDRSSQDFSAEIPLTLNIRVERKTERAIIIRRDYGLITLSVENSSGIPGLRFVIERKENGESYRAIKEFAAAELINGAYVYYDKFLEKEKTYTYRLTAYDADGSVLAISNETSI